MKAKTKLDFFMLTMALVIFLLGRQMNVIALDSNGGKMPVYLRDEVEFDWMNETVSDTHFYFHNVSHVKNFWFTDIIDLKERIASIGDVLQLLGAIIWLGVVLVIIVHIWREDGNS